MGGGPLKRGWWAWPLQESGTGEGVSVVGGACARVTAGRGRGFASEGPAPRSPSGKGRGLTVGRG